MKKIDMSDDHLQIYDNSKYHFKHLMEIGIKDPYGEDDEFILQYDKFVY